MDDETRNELRGLNRKHMHELWEKAKNGDLSGLGDEEKQLARIMLDHKDEFFNEFEFSDVLSDREFDPETESNPFLHVSIHSAVENQLEHKEPIEAYQFYLSQVKNKVSRHDTIHLIGSIFAPISLYSLSKEKNFPLDLYKSLLKKYKKKRPDKIPSCLDKDLAFIFS